MGQGLGNTKEGVRAKISFPMDFPAQFIICFGFILDKDKCADMFISFFTKYLICPKCTGKTWE